MPFSPTDIAGCVLWLKGDAGVYTDSGTTLATTTGDIVRQWNDQSGSGNHANNAAAGVYTTGIGPSSIPVVDISDSGNGAGFGTILTLAAPYTIFIALRSHTYDATGNHRYINGTNNFLIGPRGGKYSCFAVSGFVADGTTGPSVNNTDFVRMYMTNNSVASHFFVNGSDISTGTTNIGAPGGFQIDQNRAELCSGYIGEIIVYNSALSAPDQASVDTYLGRWQTVATVPSAMAVTESHDTQVATAGNTFGATISRTESLDVMVASPASVGALIATGRRDSGVMISHAVGGFVFPETRPLGKCRWFPGLRPPIRRSRVRI